MQRTASPIFVKAYDLTRWLLEHTHRFPRGHRAVLGRRLEEAALAFQDRCLAAARYEERADEELRRADLELERLRIGLRLAKDLRILSLNQYEHAARGADELGRLLGGWMRKRRGVSGGKPPS